MADELLELLSGLDDVEEILLLDGVPDNEEGGQEFVLHDLPLIDSQTLFPIDRNETDAEKTRKSDAFSPLMDLLDQRDDNIADKLEKEMTPSITKEDKQAKKKKTKSHRRLRKKPNRKLTELTPEEKKQRELSEQGLTPREILRKRNRESLQRARKREHEEVEQMRTTLQKLTQKFQELSEVTKARRQKRESTSTTASDRYDQLICDYYDTARLSHSLKEENFVLEQALAEREKASQRIYQVIHDHGREIMLSTPLSSSIAIYSIQFVPTIGVVAWEHDPKPVLKLQYLETVPPTGYGAGAFVPVKQEASTTFGWDIVYTAQLVFYLVAWLLKLVGSRRKC